MNAKTSADPRFGPEPRAAPSERLLLWSMRAWANLRLQGRQPHFEVGRALSVKAGSRVAASFVCWMQAIESGCRRPLEIGPCPTCEASADERRLIGACILAGRFAPLAAQMVEPLVREPEKVIIAGAALHIALASEGWALPARAPAACAVGPASPTIH